MRKNGDFIIKKTKVIYKNPWIKVREDRVLGPDGKKGIYGIVEIAIGVSVLPIDEENFVYLTKEFQYAISELGIKTVSGGIDGSETSLEAAKRELKEELGIEAKQWVNLGLVNPLTTLVSSPQSLFLASNLTSRKDSPEVTENITLVKVKLEEAVRMVMDSEITDGQSCVLILKASKYLNKN